MNILSLTPPIIFESKNINVHRNFYYTRGKILTSDIKVNISRLEKFDCNSDLITKHLSNNYEYRDTFKIFSKNRVALHIDGDNCINCLVNVDDKKHIDITIVLEKDNDKLSDCRLYHEDLNSLFTRLNIINSTNLQLYPGEIFIYDSNNYHSFNYNSGVKLINHKFINNIKKNKLYDPIYL